MFEGVIPLGHPGKSLPVYLRAPSRGVSLQQTNPRWSRHPSVYQLAVSNLGLEAGEICFVSSNGWDAFSAKDFGFRVLWCNRTGQPPEKIPEAPDAEIRSLSDIPTFVRVG